MKKLIVIALVLTLFVVPVMAQDEKPELTREEQLTQSLIEMKFQLGKEMQISAQQQAQIIELRKQLAKMKTELVECLKKVEPVEAEAPKD